ncbi:hypothetical protein [Chitinimonas sp. BJYL2]|uniref:hypothetical protein n=1 Tax=Chitinimonas sp. BJYL2 TaxID=2976696 RepID=UPI0022B4F524|nr:hypothetical protein [Chitinimonas sp. BJYL2]
MSTCTRHYDAHDAARILEEALTQLRQHVIEAPGTVRDRLATELIDSLLNVPGLLAGGDIASDYAQQCLDKAVRNLLAPQWHDKPAQRPTFLRRPVLMAG